MATARIVAHRLVDYRCYQLRGSQYQPAQENNHLAENDLAVNGSIHPADHPGGIINRDICAGSILFCGDFNVHHRDPAKLEMVREFWLFDAWIDRQPCDLVFDNRICRYRIGMRRSPPVLDYKSQLWDNSPLSVCSAKIQGN